VQATKRAEKESRRADKGQRPPRP